MIELNLLPDVKQEFVRTERLKKAIVSLMILVCFVAGGVVIFFAVIVYAVQPGLQLLVDNQIKDSNSQLADNKNLIRDLTIQNQLATLPELHDSKVVYDRLFEYLRVLNPENPSDVVFSKASIDSSTNTLNVDATTSNYLAVAVFRDTVKNAKITYIDPATKEKQTVPLFSEVTLSDIGIAKDKDGQQIANFKAALVYEPSAFAWNIATPTVTVPNEKTTPSANRVTIFSDQTAPKNEESQQ